MKIYFFFLTFVFKLPLRVQTLNSLHCKRNPQQAKIRLVAESATLLLFFDFLCFFGFHKTIPKSLYCSKSLQKFADLRNPLTVAESRTTSCISLLRNPQQNNCAKKIYVTGIYMQNPLRICLWNSLTF